MGEAFDKRVTGQKNKLLQRGMTVEREGKVERLHC